MVKNMYIIPKRGIPVIGQVVTATCKQVSFWKGMGPHDLNKMISKVYGCKIGQGESDKYSVNTESRCGCMQYLYAESSNISKFVCGIIKSSCSESSR